MMDQSGHKSIDTLRGYVRDGELFKDHAGVGLLWASLPAWSIFTGSPARRWRRYSPLRWL